MAAAPSGLTGIKSIEELELTGKRLFLRLDLNVPLKDGKITDDTRITAAVPTIRYAIEKGAKIILASHLGRPKGPEDRKKNSLEPVADRLSELLNIDVHLIEDPAGNAPKALLQTLNPAKQILLLENLRFEKGEEANDEALAGRWAAYTDVYVNDAFGASHRAHASIAALPKQIKQKGAGFLIKREIEMLDKVLHTPEHPFIALIGGAKVSDKIGVFEQLMDKVDAFLIGGAMSYTFMQAAKEPVGASKFEKDKVSLARDLIQRVEARNKKILLPVDHVVTKEFKEGAPSEVSSRIPDGMMALDIGPKTSELYAAEIRKAKTVFWNGPMGVFEMKPFEKGTFAMAHALADASDRSAITIVGGGDSVAAVNEAGLASKMTHISTGGGASLEYLEAGKLPGLDALKTPRY